MNDKSRDSQEVDFAKQAAGKSEWWVQSGGRLGSCPQQLRPKQISQTNL